jgi:hypothetical protein
LWSPTLAETSSELPARRIDVSVAPGMMSPSYLVDASRSRNLGDFAAKEAALLSGSRQETAENREGAILHRERAILDDEQDISNRLLHFWNHEI